MNSYADQQTCFVQAHRVLVQAFTASRPAWERSGQENFPQTGQRSLHPEGTQLSVTVTSTSKAPALGFQGLARFAASVIGVGQRGMYASRISWRKSLY
jgi:hypothetical protein